MDQPHLPFQIAEVYGGFARIDGIMITVEKKRRPGMRTALSEIEVRRSYLDADRLLKKQRRRQPVKKTGRQ